MSDHTLSFAKHQTFHIREGWLFKGMMAIEEATQVDEPYNLFLEKDAPERLGMGRNMVQALRFWMEATGLAQEHYEGRSVPRLVEPFGEIVWQFDPYLENDGTLWLLHYHLVCNRSLSSSWHWFFNHFSGVAFNDKQAIEALQNWVVVTEKERKVARSSLKKDVRCLLRTYLPSDKGNNPENLIESPLARLGIIKQFGSGSAKRYHWQRPDIQQLHPLILLYVMVDRQRENPSRNNQQVRLSTLLQEENNVGRVFNLTTGLLTDLIASLNNMYPDWQIVFTRTAGLDQLTLPNVTLQDILQRYYQDTQL